MNVSDLVDAMDTIAPRRYAAEWDNVGLLIGAASAECRAVMLTIDLTDEVLREAVDTGASAIVAYHPPIFRPLTAVTDATPRQRLVLEAAHHGLAVYSPHTALDAAPAGVNDWLAEALGKGDLRALELHEELPPTEETKLVTFCPADVADALRNALASIGAGRLGDYEVCSFELDGTGTFFGGKGTSPAIGEAGQLERVDEVRLEMVCPRSSLGLAMAMMRQFHPYEEPPIEIHPLLARPQRHVGHGRRVVLDQKLDLKALIDRLRHHLGVSRLQAAPSVGAPRRYRTIGLCAGAGGSLLEAAIAQECELFVTGEMRHHDVLEAQARGCTIVLAGHTNTERGYLKVLQKRLAGMLAGTAVTISRKDRDPLKVM